MNASREEFPRIVQKTIELSEGEEDGCVCVCARLTVVLVGNVVESILMLSTEIPEENEDVGIEIAKDALDVSALAVAQWIRDWNIATLLRDAA